MRHPVEINRFSGKYEFLSNFYPARVFLADLETGKVYYKTVEHAFQAAKSLDPHERETICKSYHPGNAKRMGREVQLRPDWEDVKLEIMRLLVFRKFIHNEDLMKKLLLTGKAVLIEGNYWNDTFWGVCRSEGLNHLGKILMSVRREIRYNSHRVVWLKEAINA